MKSQDSIFEGYVVNAEAFNGLAARFMLDKYLNGFSGIEVTGGFVVEVCTSFMFHSVGQGLFYSGEVKGDKEVFRFVYDCGSQRIRLVDSAVRKFKHDVGDAMIDLLILSHLHTDHTSGLDRLFSNFKVQEVILPYLTPIERLLVALSNVNMPAWFYDFLSDPVVFLMERRVERIIIIGGEVGGEGGVPPTESRPSLPPEGDFPSKIDLRGLPDDEELRREILRNDGDWRKYMNMRRLLIKNHNGCVVAIGLWLFRFFNYKVSPSALQNFIKCLGKMGFKLPNNEEIKRIIRDKHSLRRLKRCYNSIVRKLNNDFNNSSLVVYHGPKDGVAIKNTICVFSPLCYPHESCQYFSSQFTFFVKKSGQLLTGDINLNLEHKYNELEKHYHGCFNNVIVGLVPHHGAGRNWKYKLLESTSESKIWVVSAGFANRYGHPSPEVIESILSKGKRCVWVNELNYLLIKSKIKRQLSDQKK